MAAFLLSPGVSVSTQVKSSFVSGSRCRVRVRRTPTRVRMGLDPSQLSGIADQITQLHDSLVANTILLADAVAASPAADAAAEVVEKRGIWGSFVKLIEASIQSIHSGLSGVGIPYSYGFSIIGFTVIVKLLTLPLNVKQMESTMKMQAMQPKVKQIQAQYRDNPNVLNQRLANLYKEENVNPLAGCLPVLAQTPIWIALYRAVLNMSKDNLLDESFLWVPSLQGPVAQGGNVKDWLFPLVNGAPPIGWHDALCYLVFPIVLVVTQTYSQRVLTPPSQDKQTQQANAILRFLPFMLGWFSLSVPSGLTVYWVTNNVLSTAQTLVLRNRFTENQGTETDTSKVMDVESRPVSTQLSEADGFSNTSKGSKKKSSKKRRK